MDIDRRNRIREIVIKAFALVCIGLLYALIYVNTNFKIPCIFYNVTGLFCPGCGVSAMCISLLGLDFKTAFFYNPAIMIMLPFLIILFTGILLNYIKKGNYKLSKRQNLAAWAFIVYFIAYGIIRNIDF